MASLVSSSLDLIRRRKAPKHPRLHARWGDVTITAPTEGAWTQFNTSYRSEKPNYGPGFVPGCSAKEDNDSWAEEDVSCKESNSKRTGSTAVLKSCRLTRILAPSNLNPTISKEPQEHQEDTGFEYKPVRPDYAQEITEEIDRQNAPRFRYVPASQKYLRDVVGEIESGIGTENGQPARSRSCEPSFGTSTVLKDARLQPRGVQEMMGRDSLQGLSSATMPRRSSRDSSVSGTRDDSRERVKQQKTPASPLERSQSAMTHRRKMTLTMVSDPDELW